MSIIAHYELQQNILNLLVSHLCCMILPKCLILSTPYLDEL